MPKRVKSRQTLAEVLHSLADAFGLARRDETSVAIDSRRADGDTPLHVLVRAGNTHAVQLLIDAGADVDALGDMSETPLHIALRKEDLASVTALIRAGARLDLRSDFDETPIDIAESLGGAFKRLLRHR